MHSFRDFPRRRLGRHVRLIMPPTLDVALDVAERAEREFSDQPSLQLSTEDDCQDQSGPAKHCCHRCGARLDAAGPALSRGTMTVAFQSGQDKERFRKPRPPDLEPQQCRQLGLVEDCGWMGQRATHPRPSCRRGRRRARRRRATEDGVLELHSSAPLRRKLVGKLVGATMEVIPDHTPRTSRDCWRRASQPGRKAAPQRGYSWQWPRWRRRPPELSGLCVGCWGRRVV
jgi:hypothetical protein